MDLPPSADMAGPVDVVLLRGVLPDLALRPGTTVSGRVLDGRTLVLAGVKLNAQLPDGLAPGEILRLRVEEAGTDRVHLRIVPASAPPAEGVDPAAVPPTAYALALPGGTQVRIAVTEREEEAARGGGAPAARSVLVRFDSPTMGRLDIRLDRSSAAVHVSQGEPADRVRGAADVLRAALAQASGAPVQVTVHPREETLDVRA